MVTPLPRVVIAAPSTGQGKTTLATGLMAALRAAGHAVSGHKVGPDYIDPGYHALATGRPGRNLDPHLAGEDRIAPLLLHGAAGTDVAVIEGVMGLHDGRLGTDGLASTAHVARLTGSPVLLVVDIARMSRSAAAVVQGMATFDPGVTVAGVILNRAGSQRNTAEIRSAVEDLGFPVVGVLPRDEDLATPSRHLGLVPAAERRESRRLIDRLGEQVGRHVDLAAVLDVARSAPALDCSAWDPRAEVTRSGPGRPVVAVAGGRAFTFRYPETEELLRAAGCEPVIFDPATDALPDGTRGIYLGGGFPEVYAADLAANAVLLEQVRAAAAAGVPIVAECAGLLYLARTLDDETMARVIPADAAMTQRLTLRYPEATATQDTLLTRAGESVTGHEFHRTATVPAAGPTPAWEVDGAPAGFAGPTLHASYLHVYWAGHPQLAQRFSDAVHVAPQAPAPNTAKAPAAWSTPSVAAVDPLRYHGDQASHPRLVDFAVNVHPGPRPAWLDRALSDALKEAARYPDASAARDAIAAYHARPVDEILATSGAAEAFSLIARYRDWCRPVVVHPQFTEPHAALEAAGHDVTPVLLPRRTGFALDPTGIPDDADLVMLGNPTNPTGVLHPAETIRPLLRPGRLVVVDEAFLDHPEAAESLVADRDAGLLVVRSLTKLWSIPGIRAGYVTGNPETIAGLARLQPPWSVSGPALAAITACLSSRGDAEARRRAADLAGWRDALQQGLASRGIDHLPSSAPFVLARLDGTTRTALRDRGIATRTAATFPGLDDGWTRLAARPPATTRRLFDALDGIRRA